MISGNAWKNALPRHRHHLLQAAKSRHLLHQKLFRLTLLHRIMVPHRLSAAPLHRSFILLHPSTVLLPHIDVRRPLTEDLPLPIDVRRPLIITPPHRTVGAVQVSMNCPSQTHITIAMKTEIMILSMIPWLG